MQRFVDVVLIWIQHMVFVDMITVLLSLIQLVKCAGNISECDTIEHLACSRSSESRKDDGKLTTEK